MYELTCRIKEVSFDYFSEKLLVTLAMNEDYSAKKMIDDLKSQEKLTLKIDKYREKRSLNANAYAWQLIGKIGNCTRESSKCLVGPIHIPNESIEVVDGVLAVTISISIVLTFCGCGNDILLKHTDVNRNYEERTNHIYKVVGRKAIHLVL